MMKRRINSVFYFYTSFPRKQAPNLSLCRKNKVYCKFAAHLVFRLHDIKYEPASPEKGSYAPTRWHSAAAYPSQQTTQQQNSEIMKRFKQKVLNKLFKLLFHEICDFTSNLNAVNELYLDQVSYENDASGIFRCIKYSMHFVKSQTWYCLSTH